MSFAEKLQMISNLVSQDTERCLELLSSKAFLKNLFYPQLVALTNMFESLLIAKTTSSKQGHESKNLMKPQLIIALYSIIIMRSSSINIRRDVNTNVATKINQNSQLIYNPKQAIETLTKVYRSMDESDNSRPIVAGLLLKIKGFSHYKMIIKDISPAFVSESTMNMHFQVMRGQCPNLLDVQLDKYKIQWGKYLRFKPISLGNLKGLLEKLMDKEKQCKLEPLNDIFDEIDQELSYVLNRFIMVEENREFESLAIDELIRSIDEIYPKLVQRVKETAQVLSKTTKNSQKHLEYDSNQCIHKSYLRTLYNVLKIVNQMITSLGLNWLRKIKWLYNFILTLFLNFDIKGHNFHESIAAEYSKIFQITLQLFTNYLMTFKSGMFPQGKLSELAFSQEYSVYKLVQAILYNEYPFNEIEMVQYQNYQKQRRNHDNKHKQYLIDTVNFNMKSLNINIHWDSLLIKIIPNLKNSMKFGKDIVYQALLFLLKYLQITNFHQEASKLLLMIANARNHFFVQDKNISSLIKRIKGVVYPHQQEIQEGIQYFCQEYFSQFKAHSQRKIEEEENIRKKRGHLDLYQTDSLQFNNVGAIKIDKKIKKTQSYDSMLEGWEQFESAKDSSLKDVKENSGSEPKEIKSQNMFQSVDSEHNEIFYSINESKHEKIMEEIKEDKEPAQKSYKEEDILIPEF